MTVVATSIGAGKAAETLSREAAVCARLVLLRRCH